mmetsp:Transcript_1727/g.4879  ORF Transcript_1727/g.4879 Transcript_1727/m.4879 type:complete len:211 (-) Transcript_1727:982-1614(-)
MAATAIAGFGMTTGTAAGAGAGAPKDGVHSFAVALSFVDFLAFPASSPALASSAGFAAGAAAAGAAFAAPFPGFAAAAAAGLAFAAAGAGAFAAGLAAAAGAAGALAGARVAWGAGALALARPGGAPTSGLAPGFALSDAGAPLRQAPCDAPLRMTPEKRSSSVTVSSILCPRSSAMCTLELFLPSISRARRSASRICVSVNLPLSRRVV